MNDSALHTLTNDELISGLHAICARSRQGDVQLIAHLIEMEARSLHLVVACSSLYDFCVDRLGMSGGASQRRLVVARLARRFPSLLGHLENGNVHLSHVIALRDHLTEENVEELVEAVSRRPMREVEEILAARMPRPDVPESLEDLPVQPGAGASASSWTSSMRSGRIKPLSERRCLLQVSVSKELRKKLETARDLMRHRNPKGDLETVLDAALDGLLEKLAKERHGKVAKPRAGRPRPTKAGIIPRAVRREVFERDGHRCTFVDAQDRRCPARTLLEIDHVVPRAMGGPDEASNLRLLCRAHNRLQAETVFGKEHVAARIHDRQQRVHDRKDGTGDAAYSAALGQLVMFGFGGPRAQRALASISRQPARTVEELVSEAIDVLCPDAPPPLWEPEIEESRPELQ